MSLVVIDLHKLINKGQNSSNFTQMGATFLLTAACVYKLSRVEGCFDR
jgi:hypothetical protein